MKVYVVRHGESVANISKIHQTPDEPLSPNGAKQAKDVAIRFKTIPVETIITSPYKRALHTAQEIQAVTNAQLIENDRFVEIRRPSDLEGLVMDSEEAKTVFREIIENEQDPTWHHSDEENFFDLKKRVEEALQFLEGRSEEKLAVVTHSFFMRMMLGVITFEEDFNPRLIRKLGNHFKIHNTGITVLNFEDNKWQLLTWNDYAHLGD